MNKGRIRLVYLEMKEVRHARNSQSSSITLRKGKLDEGEKVALMGF